MQSIYETPHSFFLDRSCNGSSPIPFSAASSTAMVLSFRRPARQRALSNAARSTALNSICLARARTGPISRKHLVRTARSFHRAQRHREIPVLQAASPARMFHGSRGGAPPVMANCAAESTRGFCHRCLRKFFFFFYRRPEKSWRRQYLHLRPGSKGLEIWGN